MAKDFSILEKKIGLDFKNKDLLKQAFCHRSYLNENPGFNLTNNERLEFLGDAVLELVSTEFLYEKYPAKSEGELTSWRAALVNAESLAQTARLLGYNEYLLLSRGEAKDTGKARNFILSNAFEAVVGALYLDSGYQSCDFFIKKHLLKKLPEIIKNRLYRDAKSHFQEMAQEMNGVTPVYKVLEESGPDHARHFVIGVYWGESLIAKGEGSSKQEAETAAAGNALKTKDWNNSH